MTSSPASAESYVAALPEQRREFVSALREVVLANLQPGFEEGIEYGMLSYHVPVESFPDTYNGRPLGLAALASRKSYVSLYLMSVYGDGEEESWFRDRWRASGQRLDMGRACVRLKRLEDLPLDVVGEAISRTSVERVIASHERRHG